MEHRELIHAVNEHQTLILTLETKQKKIEAKIERQKEVLKQPQSEDSIDDLRSTLASLEVKYSDVQRQRSEMNHKFKADLKEVLDKITEVSGKVRCLEK